jgi:hypothetical protein
MFLALDAGFSLVEKAPESAQACMNTKDEKTNATKERNTQSSPPSSRGTATDTLKVS